MSSLKRSNNLAARMGRWSASHKKTAIFGWLAFIAVAFMLGNAVGTKQLDQNKTAPASQDTSTRCSATSSSRLRATRS